MADRNSASTGETPLVFQEIQNEPVLWSSNPFTPDFSSNNNAHKIQSDTAVKLPISSESTLQKPRTESTDQISTTCKHSTQPALVLPSEKVVSHYNSDNNATSRDTRIPTQRQVTSPSHETSIQKSRITETVRGNIFEVLYNEYKNGNQAQLSDSSGCTVSGHEEYLKSKEALRRIHQKDTTLEADTKCNHIGTSAPSSEVSNRLLRQAAQLILDKRIGKNSRLHSEYSSTKSFHRAKDKVNKIGQHVTEGIRKQQHRKEIHPIAVRQYENDEHHKRQVEETLMELEKEDIAHWDEERRCSICFYSSCLKMSLKWHMKSHLQTLDEGFKCPLCLYTSKVESLVRDHYNKCHPQHSSEISSHSASTPDDENRVNHENTPSSSPESLRVSIFILLSNISSMISIMQLLVHIRCNRSLVVAFYICVN